MHLPSAEWLKRAAFKGSSILISWLKCHKLQRTLLWKEPRTTYNNSKACIWKISITALENKLPILKNTVPAYPEKLLFQLSNRKIVQKYRMDFLHSLKLWWRYMKVFVYIDTALLWRNIEAYIGVKTGLMYLNSLQLFFLLNSPYWLFQIQM